MNLFYQKIIFLRLLVDKVLWSVFFVLISNSVLAQNVSKMSKGKDIGTIYLERKISNFEQPPEIEDTKKLQNPNTEKKHMEKKAIDKNSSQALNKNLKTKKKAITKKESVTQDKPFSKEKKIYGRYDHSRKALVTVKTKGMLQTVLTPRKDFKDRIMNSFRSQ